MVELGKLDGLAAWLTTRAEMETAIKQAMVPHTAPTVDPQVTIVDEQSRPGYVRKRVNYFVSDWERVTAWLFEPDGAADNPALVCCHHECPHAKDAAAGLEGDKSLALALHYAQRGYVTIAPDAMTAGERVSSNRPPYDATSFYKEHRKTSLLGKMLADHKQALNVLEDTRSVDPDRLGVVGHGLGGASALLLAAFDDRVQACVASCAFTRFKDDPDPTRWCVADPGFAGFQGLNLSPQLAPLFANGAPDFDWEHICALAAPNPTLIIAGTGDEILPRANSCMDAVKAAKAVYEMLNAPEGLLCHVHEAGRTFPREALDIADQWLDRWL